MVMYISGTLIQNIPMYLYRYLKATSDIIVEPQESLATKSWHAAAEAYHQKDLRYTTQGERHPKHLFFLPFHVVYSTVDI